MGPILKGIGMTALAVEKFGGDAARKGYFSLCERTCSKTSKFISGTRKKAHKGSRLFGQAIKENPKLSSFIAGGYVSKKLNEDD